MFRGDLTRFFGRPICVVLIAIMVITIVFGVISKAKIKQTVGDEESEM